MAVSATKAHVIITADSKSARNAIDQMKKSLTDMENKLKSLPEGSKQWSNMQKRIGNVKSAIEQSEREFASLDSVLNNLSGSSFRQLNKAYNQITQQIKSHSRATEQDRAELRKLISDQKKLEQEMHKVSGMWKTQEGAINSVIKRLSAYVAVYGGFNMIMGKITEMTKKNLEFSDSISDIQKVSGLSQKEVENLTYEIAKIDSRNSQQELDRLAYAAGKLGIGTREGAEGILQFTKAADKLQVALKEYLGEDGVVSLMKVSDVMGDTKKYGVEQALLKTGSAVNYMTQSTAAAADYMVDFLARTGGMGKAANITTPELVGLASTLDSLSQNVEVSATALNKFFAQLMTHQSAIAKATGLSKEWVQTQLQQGHTMEVVMTIFDKLGEKGGLSALGPLFKDLGSDGARLMQVMTQLANNSDRVRAYVAMSNQAFKEGTSVTNEYAIKNQNAAAIMARMANSWDKMFVNANNTGVLKGIAQDLYDTSKALQNSEFWVTSLSLAFKALVFAAKSFIVLLPVIINGFAAFKIAQLVTYFLKLIPAIQATARAMAFLNAASGWIGAIVAGISLLVYGISSLSEASAKAKIKVDELGDSLRKTNKAAQAELVKTKKEVDGLFAALNKENITQNERKNIIAQINTQYKDYLPKLLSEKSSADEIAKAWDTVNSKLKANILLKAKQTDLEKITDKYSRRQGDALENLGNTLDDRIGNDRRKGKGNRSVDIQERVKSLTNNKVGEAIKKGGSASTVATAVMNDEKIRESIRGNAHIADYNRIASGQLSQDAYIKERQSIAYLKEKDKAEKEKIHLTPADRTRILQEAERIAKQDWEAIAAVRREVYDYATAKLMEHKDTKRTNEYWNRLIPEGAEETPTTNIVITEDTSKEDAKAARAAAAEARKELREMRKEAQEELKGVKSIITAFYEQREAEIQADFEAGLITEIQRTELLSETAMQKAQTMIDAWNVMLGKSGSTEIWAERLKAMQGQIYGGSAEMETTLDDIAKRNLVKTGQLLNNFGTSMKDGLKRTVAQNENIIQTHLAGVKERIHSALKEYDYVFKALDKAQKNLETQGLVSLSDDKLKQISSRNEQAKVNPAIVPTSIDAEMKNMLGDINKNYQQLFTIDINTDEGIGKFSDMLSTVNGLAKSSFTRTADESQQAYKERMQLFYRMLIEMGEGVEQAQKQARKEFITSAKLAYTASGKEEADKENTRQAQMGVDSNSKLGVVGLDSKLAADNMEIKLYEAKLEAAANYYDFLKERGADAVTLREQEMVIEQTAMDLADKMIAKTADRLQALKEIGTSIETFGEEFGEAIDGTLADRQDAAKNLLKSLGNVTKKMISEWVKQRIQKAINNKLMQKQEKAHQAFELSTATETSAKKGVIKQVEGTTLQSIQQTTNTTLETDQKAHDSQEISEQGTKTTMSSSLSLAEAVAKCFGSLGPVGGAIAAATVTAAIGAILAWAMSKIGGSADTPSSATTSTTKLASGMLTYDAGNVQRFRTLDDGTVAAVRGTDGQTYNARVQSSIDTGVVSSPVATLINGQPSIVGEKGAEMVIGRQTFAAMRTLRPDIIQQIVRFDRNRSGASFRTYDEGNVGEFAASGDIAASVMGNNPEMMALLSSNRDTNVALINAITGLNAQLAAGIGVRKFGPGGVVDEVADGFNFLKGKSSNMNIKRLFG